ncbi:exonuclease domain-containing protein [Nocardia sp. NPDC088792]|uniref:3'-5' exonuclease n=1 Tax=Nocardia sp. NPDC088792 TaxID=3364332 RepID=UPI003829E2B0
MIAEVAEALRGKRLAVVDVEGNGHNPAPEIIEIAIVPIDGHVVDAEDLRCWLVRPQNPINPVVTRKVHGIRDSDVADCPQWAQIAPTVGAALSGRVLVAHNATVEHKALSSHLPLWEPPMVLDTLRLAKVVWPHLSGYGLDALIEHAALDMAAVCDQRRHRAAYDAWAAWQLLHRLVLDGDLDWDALVRAGGLPEFVPAPEPEGGLW